MTDTSLVAPPLQAEILAMGRRIAELEAELQRVTKSPASSTTQKCENCKFWERSLDALGSCRRHAPRPVYAKLMVAMLYPNLGYAGTVSGDLTSEWPETLFHDWCGEFERAVDTEALE